VDTGGTFTDCVWLEDGALHMLKVFSTPHDPSAAIAEGLQKIQSSAPVLLLHGTTVGTNTLLQRKGARVAFVTTAGFEDSIEIGRQARPKLYDFFFDRIEPLVPAELRFGVDERVASDGELLRAPSAAELAEVAQRVKDSGAQAIAISLLFAFANPANEQRAAESLAKLDLPLSIGHELLPEFREYERASTVVMNAYLQPVMQRYLENLGRGMQQRERVFVMQSSGGLAPVHTAAREPVRTVLSGPAGGVVGATAVSKRSGFTKIVAFDMRGTSTDVCLVDGTPVTTNEGEISGLPIRVPMLNIHTVGAGGGSLARFDAGGALLVGPESAGADPGPICYGRGTQPTVTDANLLLGRLPADQFLGGEFVLDVERTRALTREWLKRQSVRMTLENFAEGMVRVVNSNMEKALRLVSIEKGYDPREFSLVAFGGAGALHACDVAAQLGIGRVIVPLMPGALSALGILMSDVVKDFSRTVLWRVQGELPKAKLEREFRALRSAAQKAFGGEGWSHRSGIAMKMSADLRYSGQGFELNVPFAADMLRQFHAQHEARYGYQSPERPLEIVTVRLRASLSSPPLQWPKLKKRSGSAKPQQWTTAIFSGKKMKTGIYLREQLAPGARLRGPAVIAEYSATAVVPPGYVARVDDAGNILIAQR
jgi:N-methylhydantoinase A